jgi:threonine aldolase
MMARQRKDRAMTTLRFLAAAGLVALSLQVAQACDDFDEEMAMAAAREAAQLARAQTDTGRQEAAAPVAVASEVAAVTPQASNDTPAPVSR